MLFCILPSLKTVGYFAFAFIGKKLSYFSTACYGKKLDKFKLKPKSTQIIY